MKKSLYFAFAAVNLATYADIEIIEEFTLDSNQTVMVEAGRTVRIEKLLGNSEAILTKDGDGCLEIASVKNKNASIHVLNGTLKSVRPVFPAVEGDVLFRVDAANPDSYDLLEENGTNFVTKLKNSNSLNPGIWAAKTQSRPNPFLKTDGLNGLPVLDFGSFCCKEQLSGYGAAMELNEKYLIGELLYVWQDYEDVENIPTNGARLILGPNPVNLRYSYRGAGGGGAGYPMYYTAASFISENLSVDGVSHKNDYLEWIPGPGWHLVSIHSENYVKSKLEDYGFYGFGWSPSTALGGTGYGGFRLAEVVACTNVLSDADRKKVVEYLQEKWLDCISFKLLNVASGAAVDTSCATIKIKSFVAAENAVVTGENLLFADSYSSLNFKAVSGTVEAVDRFVSLTRNLSFSGDAVISVPSGTAVVDRVRSGTGVIGKTGDGALELAFPDASVNSIAVTCGALEIAPLKTSGAYIHVDAAEEDTMTLSETDGKRLVTQWRDINGNGRYLKQSSEKHAYGTKSAKNYPYIVDGFTNNLPVVDFGTFNNYGNQHGWGAELDLYPMIKGSNSETNPLVYNVFAVWGDREDAKDASLNEGKEIRGPTLIGNGGAWYRGWGGGGAKFKIRDYGSSSMGNDNWVNGSFIDYVTWMMSYVPPDRLWLQNTYISSGASAQQIGGNASMNVYGEAHMRGVAGGLRLGEMLLFRYPMPRDERFRIDAALRAKWFGSANPCNYDSMSISAGASLSMPYADAIVTNFAIAGSFSARSVTVEKVMGITGDSVVSASVTLKAGATVSLRNGEDGFCELEVESINLGDRGTITIPDWEGIVCGQSFRIIKSDNVSGVPSGWKARRADGVIKAHLVTKADGVYLDFISGGTRILVR